MLNSIIYNNKEKITFYLLYSDISNSNLKKLKDYIEKTNNFFRAIYIDTDMFDEAFLPNYITKTSFYRLLIHNLLPADVDRILYLDIDIIVNGRLKLMYNIEFKDKLICAVPDEIVLKKDLNKKHLEYLHINLNHIYFNAGVILFNIKLIRNVLKKEEYNKFLYEKLNENLLFGDQDILNIVYQNKVIYLDEKFNYKPKLFSNFKINRPIIIHYYGHLKPWNKDYCYEYKKLYCKYAEDRLKYKPTNKDLLKYKMKYINREVNIIIKNILKKFKLA